MCLSMLHSVKAHSVEIKFGSYPLAPAVQFGDYFGVVEVYIVAQQEIVIPVFVVYSVTP